MSKSLKREHSAKSISIKIDKFTISTVHVIDFEINYSIESIMPYGFIEIADAINMEAQDFQDGNKKLKLEIKDANKHDWKAEFIIVNGYQVRDAGKNVVLHLELLEEQSLKISNLFWGKGYTQTTIQNVLTEFITKIKGDKSLDITAPIPIQNFSVPANKPFTQTIEYFRQKYQYFIYRTKKQFVCKDMNTILTSGTGPYEFCIEHPYGIRPGNNFYYNSIKDISIQNTNRKKVNLSLPVSKTYKLNFLKKEIDNFEYSFDKALSEVGTPGGGDGDAIIPHGDFEKVLVRDEMSELTTKAYHFQTIQDLNSVIIVVSSNVDMEVGKIISMEIDPGNGYFNKKVPEKYYKGKWLVYSITEKLVNNFPIQKIKLIKPKMK